MASQTLEGVWEEILAHSAELAGRRVRVTVLPANGTSETEKTPLNVKNRRMLEAFRQLQETPLTEEEKTILDEFEQFRKENPFTLRSSEGPK